MILAVLLVLAAALLGVFLGKLPPRVIYGLVVVVLLGVVLLLSGKLSPP